jgi:tetratricopeptide (TPR) repeat protein
LLRCSCCPRGVGIGVARSDAKEQVEFGIKVAQTGLWREAQYRWERAVELDPTYAEAWNNLADRLRAFGQVRRRAQGLRDGDQAGSEEHADPAELRPLQRDQ